ncbi:MAG: SDR family oxidoreductase [Bacteroidetes bacterium]|nr:SDR family oxidoreductase [Bacteroidota bacterium]
MKYLVTGGAGFIGSNITRSLLQKGEFVSVFDNLSTGRIENIAPFTGNPLFKLFEGDLRNYNELLKACEGIDFILHQGALPSVPRSVADPLTSNNVNILGTLHVLLAARETGVKRVVYASSSSVYGNNPTLPKVENMPVSPLSPYALTKYSGERYCQIFNDIYSLQTVCLRYFNVFGPNQDPTSQYSAVIPKFIRLIKQGKQPVIYGDGLQSRDFTFVDNNINANILASTAPDAAGKVFNIACGERYTLIDLVDNLNQIMGTNIRPMFENSRPGDVKHSMADINKAREILGYNVNVSFPEGLKKTVEFFS